MGHDRRGGPSPISEDGGYNDVTYDASPKEATVETETYINSHNTDNNSAGIRFRFQDIDNHYVCGISTNRNDFWVNKHIDGNIYNVATINVDNSLSNGSFFTQKLQMVETDSGLQFILSIDGTTEAQITDTNPHFNDGGAVGVGMKGDDGDAANNNSAYTGWWTDNTKITY